MYKYFSFSTCSNCMREGVFPQEAGSQKRLFVSGASTGTLFNVFQPARGGFRSWRKLQTFYLQSKRYLDMGRMGFMKRLPRGFSHCNATMSSKKQCTLQCIEVPVLNLQSSLLESAHSTGFGMCFIVSVHLLLCHFLPIDCKHLRTAVVVLFISGPHTGPGRGLALRKGLRNVWLLNCRCQKAPPPSGTTWDQGAGTRIFRDSLAQRVFTTHWLWDLGKVIYFSVIYFIKWR